MRVLVDAQLPPALARRLVDPNVAEIWHRDLRWPRKLNRKTDLLGRSGKPPSVASRSSLSMAKIPPVWWANEHRTIWDFCNAGVEKGHEAEHVPDIALVEAADRAIWERAR